MHVRFVRVCIITLCGVMFGTGFGRAATPVLDAPQIFAPGIVSAGASDGSPTFSPDGNTLFFARSSATWSIILESDRSGGRWSEPHIAPFSGQWSDWAPEFSPDGKYVVFVSIRPQTHANLWRSDRTASGWSAPVRLPDAVNIGPSVWKPSMAGDGSIYFVSIDAKGAKRLYCSRYKDGAYRPAQPLSFSDGTTGDVDPEVAPDESFMLFASDGRIAGDGKDHLFVSFNAAGKWQAPIAIRYAGDTAGGYSTDNEPHLSHDLRTVYFTSDRVTATHFPRTPEQAQADVDRLNSWDNTNANAWFVSLAPLLDGHRAGFVPDTAAASAVSAAPAAAATSANVEAQPTEAGIRAVEAHWTHAFVHGDTAYLQTLFAPNYVSVNAKGVVRSRAVIIALAEAMGKTTVPSLPAQVLRVDVRGNAAIVTSSDGGQQSSDAFYYEDGAWHAWYSQHTAKP
jgi:Domain of unknown function (DUF4440)/WD40-like Beta Propeller Repeat